MRKSRKTLSVDLRERILASYDEGEYTLQEVADRYRVSLGMVRKLRAQRQKTGDIRPRHRYSGRKPYFTPDKRRRLGEMIRQRPDLTLEELREALALDCTLPAIHYVLCGMNLSFKKSAARQRARARRRQAGA
jgi:transposase